MREQMTNVILDLFVSQAAEPQDDDARKRLEHAKEVLESGRARATREAEAAEAKELKYAEKLLRRAAKLAAGPPAPGAAGSDSESELPVPAYAKSTRAKKLASGDAGVAAAAADDVDEPRRISGRPRRTSRPAAAYAEYDQAPAPSDSEFEQEKPKKPKYRLSRAVLENDEQEAMDDGVPVSTRAKTRSNAKGAASAAPPADAIDMDTFDGAPGFLGSGAPDHDGAPDFDGGAPGFVSPASAGARFSSSPPVAAAAAEGWGQPVPIVASPPVPIAASPDDDFALVPSQPPPPQQQPLKAPVAPTYGRRRANVAAPEPPVERPAAPAPDFITVLDDDDDDDAVGTQSL